MNASGWQIFVEVPGKAPIELPVGEAVIGRSRACAVQVAETTVSRQHAVFVVEPGNVRLKDLGSSNGTYVNGKRVDGSIGLSDGDKVVVGEAELVLRILAPLGPAEATQKLVLPPMSAPMPAPVPESGFRRTPTAVDSVAIPPPPVETPASAAVTARPAPPPIPSPPPLPSPPPAAAQRPAPAASLAPKGGEILGSIQEIDSVPIPPAPSAAARKAPGADRTELAGFWIRAAATLLDSIPYLGLAIVFGILGYFVSPKLFFLAYPLMLAYGAYVIVVMPALQGTTPGKKFLKLAIVSDSTVPGHGLGWSTALIRWVGYMVCGMTFGLGYLLVAFTAQKQGLHDLIAKTRVVRRR